ncbi:MULTISPECIES: hypothetical protein [Sphingobacterium]|uniref:hypothetical protein n=1 Tax=Sphingobacterium TaxID=28453 RepID=UPI0013DC1C64|nr:MULTISPECIES: hypothetical protein [unclassified Sphingobacterium]
MSWLSILKKRYIRKSADLPVLVELKYRPAFQLDSITFFHTVWQVYGDDSAVANHNLGGGSLMTERFAGLLPLAKIGECFGSLRFERFDPPVIVGICCRWLYAFLHIAFFFQFSFLENITRS